MENTRPVWTDAAGGAAQVLDADCPFADMCSSTYGHACSDFGSTLDSDLLFCSQGDAGCDVGRSPHFDGQPTDQYSTYDDERSSCGHTLYHIVYGDEGRDIDF
ncbi:unnamed protein product [Prorocentrum cordatum]|uniref:Subtilisin n=1 Tax=Prorocentrum cordatum TaxID=2364126 RepID=A0ABN9TQ58_9DINO|nr:unnamed protein product [Polarella glacialis]